MKHFAVVFVVTLLCQLANAQSFNIDIDIGFGGYEAGAGAPSSSFGGAADQVGYWNRIRDSGGVHQHALTTLDGVVSSVTLQYNQSGALGGSGWNGNDGDHRLLMNDGVRITIPATFTFSNVQTGRYRVITYMADRSGEDIPGDVTIHGADVETKVSGVGGMPGNVFIEGRTHSVHDITLSTSTIAVLARTNPFNGTYTSLLGFQIVKVAVPEPGGLLGLTLGSIMFISLVRRRQSSSNGEHWWLGGQHE
ncbi:MAG TPA: PEP-CTERM sorting domain-containing protein [Fimbriimonadaceae bacterium]|nr:PEP-CTERM sorting domain-containing protein [Fimbriimonadaceae bacterium]